MKQGFYSIKTIVFSTIAAIGILISSLPLMAGAAEYTGTCVNGKVGAKDSSGKTLTLMIEGYKTVSCTSNTKITLDFFTKPRNGSNGEGIMLDAVVKIEGPHQLPDQMDQGAKEKTSLIASTLQERPFNRSQKGIGSSVKA